MTGSEHADIRFETEDAVATITLDCPAQMNRLNPDSLRHFGTLVDRLAKDDTVQAVVITGAGEDWFCAGLMNPDIRAGMTKDEVVAYVFEGNRIFDALEALPQITIAAIAGKVVAGGSELALACDIRIVSQDAALMLPEAKWGGFPGAGAPHRLPMVVGYSHALELIATGRQIDAREMERIGFAQHLKPAGDVKAAALETARAIAANGPLATRGAKRIARIRREPGFRAARDLSDALRHALEWSDDVDEGMAAIRENRTPRFTGR